MDAQVAQRWVRMYRTLEQSHIAPEATLGTDFDDNVGEIEKALGIVVNIDKRRVLLGISLLAGPS